MSTRHRVNFSLYRENTRPRQLRGYLALAGLDGAVDRLADEVTNLRARRAFSAAVPAHVAAECETLLFRDGELCLYVQQGAWASWLRGRSERILGQIQSAGAAVKRVRVVVAPRGAVSGRRPVDRPLLPGAEAPTLVRQVAETVTNPELKASLGRLAQRLAAVRARDNAGDDPE